MIHTGDAIRHQAMPLGGIGAGQVSIGGDGGLRQWQLLGRPNHLGTLPDSLFLIRANRYQPPLDMTRVLQSEEALALSRGRTPMVNDDHIPGWQRDVVSRFGGVQRTSVKAVYPRTEIEFIDQRLPLSVMLAAWCPLVPLDEHQSGLPAAVFEFTVMNTDDTQISGCIAGSLQNAVGWDGYTPITGNRCPLYGTNINKVRCSEGMTAVVMENAALSDGDPLYGQMAIAALGDLVIPYERWTGIDQLVEFVNGAGFSFERPWQSTAEFLENRSHGPLSSVACGPSPMGETWNAALAVPFRLDPGGRTTITMIMSWYFPNRVVDFDQWGPDHGFGKSVFWLGNAYATRFRDAEQVVEHVVENVAEMAATTGAWIETFESSSLPDWLSAGMAAQLAAIRSPTTFWTADGNFFGFEGCLGASTTHWSGAWGGSCPLNCTHVWNYEQALSRLFPRLERSMRDTELGVTQAPEGYLPHRVILPLYLPQLWDVPSLGPIDPALDGMLGCPLKVLRELRQSGDRGWASEQWPRIVRLMEYVISKWDPGETGILRGDQPNTYDKAFQGANTFIGSLWLAALLAVERLAELEGDTAWQQRAMRLFDLGSVGYDQLLWNGEYYEQETVTGAEHDYGRGCLTDQLLGQWWAHQLDLGHVLPQDHVRVALQSVFRNNFQRGFEDVVHTFRRFADGPDSGLLNCTWPLGERPEVPIEYCDETWTGSEYAFASLCLAEGLEEEALTVLAALRARYDGTTRNPFNEIECGDHYARSLAGWSVIETLGGWRYNALEGELWVSLAEEAGGRRCPIVLGGGWGELTVRGEDQQWLVSLACKWGRIDLSRISFDRELTVVSADARWGRITLGHSGRKGSVTVTSAQTLSIDRGCTIELLAANR